MIDDQRAVTKKGAEEFEESLKEFWYGLQSIKEKQKELLRKILQRKNNGKNQTF